MKARGFRPEEILFCPTTKCNLSCAHCDIEQRPGVLGKKIAVKFLSACARSGINRVGFTGGEPFLALDFMRAISKEAVRLGMLFGRIMTNGSWFHTDQELAFALKSLSLAGYDGDICLSFDAFHRQDIKKCASFIRAAGKVWARADIVSIAAVKGAKETQTRKKLAQLAGALSARLVMANKRPAAIKSENLFIRILYIDLSPVGKAAELRRAWDGRWFKDDLCKGPGNVFFVLPDGTVKPCCGYAADCEMLTIGSIMKDSPGRIIRNAQKNGFVASVFGSGLHPVRRRLEANGIKFPGKTTNHCFFCSYILNTAPRVLLRSR